MLRVSCVSGLVLCSLLMFVRMPQLAFAADADTTQRQSLQHTQKRLEDLIHAAAEQNLIALHKTPINESPTKKNASKLKKFDSDDYSQTCKSDVFTFSDAAHVSGFENIQSLKNLAVDRQGLIDIGNTKTLAMAYLGLGFADEALFISSALSGDEQAAIQAMAGILLDSTSVENRKFIQTQLPCSQGSHAWMYLLGASGTTLSDVEIKNIMEYLQSLPMSLRNILSAQLGIMALGTADTKFSEALYARMIKNNESASNSNQGQTTPAMRYFKAAYELSNTTNPKQKIMSLQTVKAFAQTDNPFQVQALHRVSTYYANQETPDMSNENKARDLEIYPGYAQDLDAATQTFAGHKNGKQAITQKISLLAQTHVYDEAITIAEDNFSKTDVYFQESAAKIGDHVLVDLQDKNANTKISALDILVRKPEFFAGLKGINLLKRAGIHAAAQLALPKLAAQIMPMDKWHTLEPPTQTLLALSLKRNNEGYDATSIFSKDILAQDAFKALAIEKAFAHKKPATAMKISNSAPNSEIVQSAFKTQAWKAGYWSLVNGDVRSQKRELKKTAAKGDHKSHSELPSAARNLATNLSANAPMLVTKNQAYDITNLTNLQSYLKNDIAVFHAYMQTSPVETPETPLDSLAKSQGGSNG